MRPGLDEEHAGQRYLDDADNAHRDCRGAALPLEIRAKALFKYGIASASRERTQSAAEALRQAIALLDRADVRRNELLIDILEYTAFVESRAETRTEALAHVKRAVELRTERYGSDSAKAAEGLVHLAMVHANLREHADAEPLLRRAIAIAERACGPQCDALVMAYAGMEPLYDALGNTAEAKKYAELGQNAVPPTRRKD